MVGGKSLCIHNQPLFGVISESNKKGFRNINRVAHGYTSINLSYALKHNRFKGEKEQYKYVV